MGPRANYLQCITCMGSEQPVERCYGWQKGNRKVRSLAEDLQEELNSISTNIYLAESTGV
jgi:hypothetical protein